MTQNTTVSNLEKHQSKVVTKHMISFRAEPLTENIKLIHKSFDSGQNMIITGCAGTGKTFNLLNKSIQEILENNNYKKIVIFRSAVPLRNIGHLPGTKEEKEAEYEAPYIQIIDETFGTKGGVVYETLKANHVIEFKTTSHNKGITINDALIIVDESQNFNYEELYNVITRTGKNSKIYLAGDYRKQDDLKNQRNDKSGLKDIMNIIQRHEPLSKIFDFHEMTVEDVVRGDENGVCKLFIEADYEYYKD